MTPLQAALAYASRGWPVIPIWWPMPHGCACRKPDCDSVGKHPLGALVTHGLTDASTDPAIISQWFRRYPSANVGIVTGPVSGIFVLDVDTKKDGEQTLVEHVVARGPLGDTLHALTGSGGDHYLFQYPSFRLQNSAGKLGPGLDTRGAGGYIVAPPSVHASGKQYTWTNPLAEVLHAPAWLLSLLQPPPEAPARTHGPPTAPLPSLRAYEALDTLVSNCAFVAYAADHPTDLTYEQWFSLATVLHPFPAGDELFDQISARDPTRYSKREARKKVATIQGAPRHCTNLGWGCPRLGQCAALDIRSPAGLPYKMRRE